jgi:hypothetical protein
MSISVNRVVTIATPLVFAPLAGAVTAYAAKHAPGVEIDQGQLQAVFIAGATIALAKSGLWLHGWQEYEKRQELLPAGAFDPAGAGEAAEASGDLADEGELDGDEPADVDHDADATAADDDDFADEDGDDLLAEMEAAFADDAHAVPADKA